MGLSMRWRSAVLMFTAAALIACGCSRKTSGPQHQMRDVDGMIVQVSVRQGLPQDASGMPGAIAGDNTLIVTLTDDKTNVPINATVSAAASTTLVGEQRPESGRAQGNGVYFVPIRFGVPDTYDIDVSVQRTGMPQSDATFKITAD